MRRNLSLVGVLGASALLAAGAARTAPTSYDIQQDARISAIEARLASPSTIASPTPLQQPAPTPTPAPSSSASCVGVASLANAVAAAPSGSTILLSGTYSLAGEVSTSKALTLQACPGGAVITSSSAVRQDYLYITGGPFTVRGVTFRAGSGVFHDSNGSALSEVEGGHDVLYEDVTFVGHPNLDDHQQLLYQRLGRNVTCNRCTFVANGSQGFGFHQYPGSTTDPNTRVQGSAFSGFSVSAAITSDSRITIDGNTFSDMRAAIQLRNSAAGSIVTNNTGTSVADPYDNTAVPFTDAGNVWR